MGRRLESWRQRFDPELGYFAASNAGCNPDLMRKFGVRAMLNARTPMMMRVVNHCENEAEAWEQWEANLENVMFTYVKADTVRQVPERVTVTPAEAKRLSAHLRALARGEPSDFFIGGFVVSKYPELNVLLGSKRIDKPGEYAIAHFSWPVAEIHLRFLPAKPMRGIFAFDASVMDYHDFTHGGWNDVRAYEYLEQPRPETHQLRAKGYLFGKQRDEDVAADRMFVPTRILENKFYPPIVVSRPARNPPR